MGPLTDDEDTEELEYAVAPGGGLVLQTEPGTYILFPAGVEAIVRKYNALAITVNPDGDIEVLKAGLGNKLRWISIVEDVD